MVVKGSKISREKREIFVNSSRLIWSSAALLASRSGFAPNRGATLETDFCCGPRSSLVLLGGFWWPVLATKDPQRVNEGQTRRRQRRVPQCYPMARDLLVALKTSFYAH